MTTKCISQPICSIRPKLSVEICKLILYENYGFTCYDIKELNGYDDKNFKVMVNESIQNIHLQEYCKNGYVLKIVNSIDSKNEKLIEAQTSLLNYLIRNGIKCPKPIKTKFGQYYFTKHIESDEHIVRILEFIPGKMFHEAVLSNKLFYELGLYTGKLDLQLQKFENSVFKSISSIWMLNSVPRLRDYVFAVNCENEKNLLMTIVDEFEKKVLKKKKKLKEGLIHGDINEQNIITECDDEGNWCISAILDFGDSCYSCLIFEIAITITYAILTAKRIDVGGYILAGFLKSIDITEFEFSILKICIEARLSQSLILGAYTHLKNPDNIYVLTTAKNGWNMLRSLRSILNDELVGKWKTIIKEMDTEI